LVARSQAEYLDHIVKCKDCGAALVSEPGAFVETSAVSTQDDPVERMATVDDARERQARVDVVTGISVIVAGLVVTAGTYALALNGGVYLIAWGPMLFGVLRLSRGVYAAKTMGERR